MEHDNVSLKEAQTVTGLLVRLLRRLTTGDDDPATELPLAQLRLCNVLAGGPRSMSAISREIGTSLSAVTQIADRLERARVIKRALRGDDRRVRCLQLTERGEKMMRLHEQTRVEQISKVLEHLNPRERHEVAAAFEMLVRASDAARGPDGEAIGHGPHFPTSKVLL